MTILYTGIKLVSSSVIGVGVGNVVSNVVKATAPETVNTASRIITGIGAGALAMAVSEFTTSSIEKQLDAIKDLIPTKKEEVVSEEPIEGTVID